jgi:TonB family protein
MWPVAMFFNQVKRQVATCWNPEKEYYRGDPKGGSYGLRYTELLIRLTADGHLISATLVKPSGLQFLDDAAIEAFKQGQPFSNPPPLLVEADGAIQFRFGFLLDPNGPPQMRWFRYKD